MRIINFLYIKYALSLLICLFSSFVVFFIFSLISNLSEDYSFNIILVLSTLNSLQILTYVSAFIFLISIILFSIFLRSRNEIIIIKSCLQINKYIIFFLPIVLLFSIFEINKKDIVAFFEDNKTNLVQVGDILKSKILINEFDNRKNITILKNVDLNNFEEAEYRSYNILNKEIKMAEFSNELIFSNDKLMLKNYTQYKNNVIKDIYQKKIINLDLIGLMSRGTLVRDTSIKNNTIINFKLINLIIFFIFLLSYIFLNFFNTKYLGSKQSLRDPILISLSALIYSFLIFNNSLTSYIQEFELIASMIMFTLFFKAYLNE